MVRGAETNGGAVGCINGRSVASTTPDPMPFQVLLIEDNPGDVQIARSALAESDLDCTLHVVRDGIDAELFLKKAGEFRQAPSPDLVMLHWRLPFPERHPVIPPIPRDSPFDPIPT